MVPSLLSEVPRQEPRNSSGVWLNVDFGFVLSFLLLISRTPWESQAPTMALPSAFYRVIESLCTLCQYF